MAEEPRSGSDSNAPRRGFRRWLFGPGTYAHPALQWLSGPAWRVAMLILVVIVFSDSSPGIGWRVAGLTLIGVSIVADLANRALLRSRHRRVHDRSVLNRLRRRSRLGR